MTDVFITIDAEVSSPFRPDWRKKGLDWEIRRDIWGATPHGDFGLPFQLGTLNRYGLKATVFTEALFTTAAGIESLRRVVRLIRDFGHDVQLHLHTEWLARTGALIPDAPDCIGELAEEQQQQVVEEALNRLEMCGAQGIRAFRAGNFGADNRTLRVLPRCGIRFDSSYNRVYLNSFCGIRTAGRPLAPWEMEGVIEFPVTCFEDWPGHFRPAQVCACSSGEWEHALLSAHRLGWPSFVMVSHGFELLKRARRYDEEAQPSWMVIRRFEALCRFLAGHRDKFRTVVFSEAAGSGLAGTQPQRGIRSWPGRTAWRYLEQAASRRLTGEHRPSEPLVPERERN